MNIGQSMLGEFDEEMKNTRKTLELVRLRYARCKTARPISLREANHDYRPIDAR